MLLWRLNQTVHMGNANKANKSVERRNFCAEKLQMSLMVKIVYLGSASSYSF